MSDLGKFDQTQAHAEGWKLISDPDDGCQLCYIRGGCLASDYEAWAVVAGHARRGSDYHIRAIGLVAFLNPSERRMIRAATGY